MVNPKHIATFLLGAAAGYALFKYNSMTDEEKEKMYDDLKEKANKLKDEAEKSFNKAGDYFEELKTKGSENMKDYMSEAENIFNDVFKKKPTEGNSSTGNV
ncbi:YtxH domain-containing protein [Lacibacter sp.]|uniref:YtxH domain-containing protein n=1 Tax=Lacibacter sp. TaxID=1915409 RepID=UPI002B4AB319|nr:YtxH domain-containing protein [Lacibacter sp.]HLP37821.1 YtxH domain-containing protein [Lacibacter sp.]